MAVPIHFVNYFTTNNILWTQMIVRFYNIFNLITQYNFTLTSMPSCSRNCYSLLMLKLISRSPLWLGSNIVAFLPGGTEFDP